MGYFTPFAQLNFNLGWALGNCFSNMLGNCIWGGGMSMPFFNSSPFMCGNYSMPYSINTIPMPSIYNIPAFNFTNNFGFDSFNCGFNSNSYNFYNFQPNFSTPYYNFGSITMPNFQSVGGKTGNNRGSNTGGKTSNTTPSRGSNPNYGGNIYCTLPKNEALQRAKNDSTLEELKGGEGWIMANTFENDIPYARKNTSKLLDLVYKKTGIKFQVTSALGTASSPHVKSAGYASHYNPRNPKLDIQPQGNISPKETARLRDAFLATGLFSRVDMEPHGGTAHLDVQFKEEAFSRV